MNVPGTVGGYVVVFSLSVSLSVWMDEAHGSGVQLIPQYPVLNQSVTLSVTGVTGTIQQFTWYKVIHGYNQLFSVIPSLNTVTAGPQYFPWASWLPNGSLQILGLVPTDQGSYMVQIWTAYTIPHRISVTLGKTKILVAWLAPKRSINKLEMI
uniref:Immunoglobulin V-set domain-containing protein n=1 Tax=Xenopus tropicalis TaxID=8364 RepID=A0A803KBR8_XENTR